MMYKFFLFLFLFSNSCFATERLYSNNEEIQNVLNSNMYTPNYLSMFIGLGIVIVLIYLTGFIYQKLIKFKISDSSNDSDKLNILSTLSLGQGKNIYIIGFDNKKILIGATQNQITFLKDITDNYN